MGWLKEILEENRQEVASWPEWKKRDVMGTPITDTRLDQPTHPCSTVTQLSNDPPTYQFSGLEGAFVPVEEYEAAQGACTMTLAKQSGHDRLWGWFGLSYASWLTLPRVLMHQMPDKWQGEMAALLEEMDEHFPNVPGMDTAVLARKDGKFVKCPSWIGYRHPDLKTIETFKESKK